MPDDKIKKVNGIRKRLQILSQQIGKDYLISESMQQQDLDLLSSLIHLEIFYFVFDIPTFSITQTGGLDNWLGYKQQSFTLESEINELHPGLKDVHHLIIKYLLEKACHGDKYFEYMQSRFIIHHAMRHQITNQYWYIKRAITPFQLTKDKKVSAYLNRCTLIGPYNNEPMVFRFYDSNPDWEPELKKHIKSNAPDVLPFTRSEYNILREYGIRPYLTAEELAQKLDISKATINIFKSRILAKARAYTGMPIHDMKACAVFFREMGMV